MTVDPLFSASRILTKATHVPLTVTVNPTATGGAIPKFNFINHLNLQPGEVAAASKVLRTPLAESLNSTLTQFEGAPLPSELPSASTFSSLSATQLLQFGKAVEGVRRAALTAMPSDATAAQQATARAALNTAVIANNGLASQQPFAPIGMLNLERLTMTPAGIQRGELLATIPLAPGETTSVVQKEWSVTSQEFTSIVTDSLEGYSETGVTDNTELAQSSTAQTSHDTQFNINASVHGNIDVVSASAASAFTSQDKNSDSATQSAKDATTLTKTASSRSKQEHKVTISTSTVSGTSQTSTRTLSNPSSNPVRIDYFSMMRRWLVQLYRYGLRLTYDVTIPEPGAALREIFARLYELQQQAAAGFSLPVTYADITESSYEQYASQYGAQVPPPAPDPLTLTVGGTIPNLGGDNDENLIYNELTFTVPDGYEISGVTLDLSLSNDAIDRGIVILGTADATSLNQNQPANTFDLGANGFLIGAQGAQVIAYSISLVGAGAALFHITLSWTDEAKAQWVETVWSALYNAAQTTFYAQQQLVNAQIAALEAQIAGVDTLTLRREENDEIMKGIVRWILGPVFDFMPQTIQTLFQDDPTTYPPQPGVPPIANPLEYGLAFTDPTLNLQAAGWDGMYQYGEVVTFINEAIEWENLIYFLYSYFWDVPVGWNFVRNIVHPDSTRQAFLRAGSARVVVPIRKGYEQQWMAFVETGKLQSTGYSSPYIDIAEQIENYDSTNYPGIPPADPQTSPPDLQAQVGTVSESKVGPSATSVTIAVESSSGFLPGYNVVIDTWDARQVQETQTVVAVPGPTQITVAALTYAHDGTATAFPIIQPGENGILITEWYEYTPTSGTDIAVNSDLTTVA